LEPKFPIPKSAEDYKYPFFAFDTKQIHAINQIDLHKQDGEMIYSTLTSFSMEASKLQTSLKKYSHTFENGENFIFG